MENRLVISTLCAAALVYACSPWIHSQNASGSAVPAARLHGIAAHKAPSTVATQFDLAHNGSRVDFALRVTNNTTKTVELQFPTALTHDVAVLDASGNKVWSSSAGRLFTQTMQALAVRSRDTLTLEDSWDARGAHGSYTAVALLATGNHPVERRIAFTLP